ncbi:MAG: DUF924 domain-containing protein [Bauldia sp.]|nr:DUF924 domain-containing protein [Bauldia sp.]
MTTAADPLRAALTDIHRYWFSELGDPDQLAPAQADRWFKQSDVTDEEIRARFGALLAPAAARQWTVSALTRTERVGLVVLFDQFPRNLFRVTGEAFAYDWLARQLADEAMREDEDYHPLERVFLYLPFEHSEALADQDRAVALFERLFAERGEANPFYKIAFEIAEKHRVLIRRFGRFPHRNLMLGRESTPEELAFLAEHGRGF